ncbi:type VII secretion integral membrane protein EccD [Mycobacterium sp. E2479]|uniref:type VII secretion integral membrane protein EccD n=1 Tax=Mycobacterium sp. E2479 TaxID=1834134 RepID=UPI0007FE0E41|nr:type VII secretion integral membrane protein EccD [Mycobacterium sp. E2479]OBH64480.1 type VII secretion integral membrane protein EccD [Mycobacterium sp. E2479]
MLASDNGLRRVSVHWETAVVDVTLPAGIPVAVLIPSVVDILQIVHSDNEAWRYRLSVPGASGLDPSMTLAQHGIGDGAPLVLSRNTAPLPAPRHLDVAEAVSATLDAATEPRRCPAHARAVRLIGVASAIVWVGVGGLAIVRNTLCLNAYRGAATTVTASVAACGLALGLAVVARRGYRDRTAGLGLGLIATAFAAVAGFVAVPGAPGMPNVLLAAAAAGATGVVAMRVSGCGVVTLTAESSCAAVIAAAALVGVFTAAPLRIVASATALVSVSLLPVAARASIALAGLSPRLGSPDAGETEPGDARTHFRAIRADRWLTSLLAGLSVSATLGAVGTVLAGAPRLSCTAFGTLTGALLLLRSRSTDTRRTLVFAFSGILVAATTFAASLSRVPMPGPWIVIATTLAVAVSMCSVFAGSARLASPVLRRSVGLLELSMLATMVPLTCWICGIYGAVRGLNLT